MESSDLRVFRMVAREGSITKAAQRLGYVQSNVTARVRQLEAELGSPLFIRNNRGVMLSASGKLLLEYADKIIGLLDEAAKAMSASHDPSGPLHIGATQTTAAVRMPALLAQFNRQYPSVQLSLMTGNSTDLIEKVLQYELDGAFVGYTAVPSELHAVPAFEEEMVLISAPSVHSIEEAITKPLLVYNKGCTYREVLEGWLRSRSWSHPVIMEFGMLEAIIGGVSAGLGISYMPRLVVRRQEEEGTIRTHMVPEDIRRMKVDFVTRKHAFTSRALDAFTAAFRDGEKERPSGLPK